MAQMYMSEQRHAAEEQRMLPCRFYANGFCAQGGRCRFYHPPAAQLANSIHCPPLPRGFGIRISRGVYAPPTRYAGPRPYDYVPTPRPTRCYFGQKPDVSMRSLSETSFDGGRRRGYMFNEIGQEGDARRTTLANGVTSTYQHGLVRYDYPNQGEGTEVRYRDEEEEGTTMFTHINWNAYLLPGMPAPPVVNVPLEDVENPQRGGGFLDRSKPGQHFGSGAENVDTPPEGKVMERKLTPREEFQLKIKSIASESEVVEGAGALSVRSMDSYFNNYKELEILPPEMVERKKKMAGTAKEETETKLYPPIPELEEGELLDSSSGDEHSNQSEEL